MSNWREQLGGEKQTEALVDWLVAYYHYPVLLVFVVFAFWNRVRNYSNFIVDDEILYQANDPWYHMRSTEYIINNFPGTMPFDPWTRFPEGTFAGQFGTLFDQLIAVTALLVGLGSPSEFTGRFVLLIAPAVFGVLVCVPAYLIGQRLGGRFGGIVAVMFVALAPDRLLQVSLAGNTQHHAAEVLFLGFAVLGFMIALRAAEKELPVYELLRERQFGELRRTLGWSMVAGAALGLYIWVWPPGVWMYGIIGAFFLVHMMAEHLRGRSPEHSAFVGVIAFATAGLMQLSLVRTLGLSATDRSLIQPGMGLAVALGVVVLAWLSREVHSRDLSRLSYPAGVAGAVVAGLVLMAVLLPGVFSFFLNQFDRTFGATIDWTDSVVWFVDISTEEGGAGTIGEATPADLDDLTEFYQFAVFTALLGGLTLLAGQVLDERPKGEELLIVVVSIFLVVATFTQIRFAYYLVLVIGALNAALVGFVMRLAGTPDRRVLPDTYQILTVAVIVFVMFVPLLGLPLIGGGETAAGFADNRSQPGDITGWSDSLDWMAENTPEPGQYANPGGEPMEYYGEFPRPADDDFEYPDGAYGVLSWWDYGHWITGKGERPANANPFQHNVDPAAEFLLAQDEQEGLDILDEEFRDQENAGTEYVMVDSLMVETETLAGGKFFAPTDFHPEFERGDFYRLLVGDLGVEAIAHKQRYYESMMVRLYHFHGSEVEPEPFVTGWVGQETRTEDGDAIVDAPEEGDSIIEEFGSLEEARQATEDDQTRQIGGIGALPEEGVPALEQFRLVHDDVVPAVPFTGGDDSAYSSAVENGMSEGPASVAFGRNVPLLQTGNTTVAGQQEAFDALYDTTPSFTKTFERVPGATIEGSLPENADVTAGDEVSISVPIDPPNGEAFDYSQTVELDGSLEFEATVPYSTVGYDEWGPDEGYTNVSARATGPYEIQVDPEGSESRFEGEVDVTEAQVIGEDDQPAEAELENVADGGEDNGDEGSVASSTVDTQTPAGTTTTTHPVVG